MDIKELEIFHTIAQERSIKGASKLLYMTPQGISKVVKNLEAELECRLFLRSSQGMALTESGERLLSYAEREIMEYYNMKKDILHIEQCKNRLVDLLSAYGILRLVTPDCITAFRAAHPEIDFQYGSIRICRLSGYLLRRRGTWRSLLGNLMRQPMMWCRLKHFP